MIYVRIYINVSGIKLPVQCACIASLSDSLTFEIIRIDNYTFACIFGWFDVFKSDASFAARLSPTRNWILILQHELNHSLI